MPALTLQPDAVLRSAAAYRACGCRWAVVAAHLDVPEAELAALVEAAGEDYTRLEAHAIWDRDHERRAAELAALRRALRKARHHSDAAERLAAEALVRYVLTVLREEWAAKKRRRRISGRLRRVGTASPLRVILSNGQLMSTLELKSSSGSGHDVVGRPFRAVRRADTGLRGGAGVDGVGVGSRSP